MKISIGKYPRYYSIYNVVDLLLYVGVSEDTCGNIGDWLNDHGFRKIFDWINKINERKFKVRIDKYDVWGMYNTLSVIITPMLKMLKDDKMGFPLVDDEDVPEDMRTGPYPSEPPYHDDRHEAKWNYILDEMIFAFETIENEIRYDIDWTEKYYTGKADYLSKEVIIDGETLWEMYEGPAHTLKCDRVGLNAEAARISNGFRLFGKYYQNLWS